MSNEPARAMDELFDGDEVREVLREAFYKPAQVPVVKPLAKVKAKRKRKPKPTHYEVLCISMYRDDLDRLDAEVARLKESGHTKMSRSGLIRFALDHMDTSKLPKAY
jgi:hypothetical protein